MNHIYEKSNEILMCIQSSRTCTLIFCTRFVTRMKIISRKGVDLELFVVSKECSFLCKYVEKNEQSHF